MIRIPLTQNKVALVDNTDADLAHHKWYAARDGKTFYARRTIRSRSGKRTTKDLHRVIGERLHFHGEVDHVDRNGLNCRRRNLRPACNKQTVWNRGKRRDNTSGFIGVNKCGNRWRAEIWLNGKNVLIGYFPLTENGCIAAARAYDKWALELRGNRAVLNFPTKPH